MTTPSVAVASSSDVSKLNDPLHSPDFRRWFSENSAKLSEITSTVWKYALIPLVAFTAMWLQSSILPNAKSPSIDDVLRIQQSLVSLAQQVAHSTLNDTTLWVEDLDSNTSRPLSMVLLQHISVQSDALHRLFIVQLGRWEVSLHNCPTSVLPTFFYMLGIHPLHIAFIFVTVLAALMKDPDALTSRGSKLTRATLAVLMVLGSTATLLVLEFLAFPMFRYALASLAKIKAAHW